MQDNVTDQEREGDSATHDSMRDGADPGMPGGGPDTAGRHHQTEGWPVGRPIAKGHRAARRPVAGAYASLLVGVTVVLACAAFIGWRVPRMDARLAPNAGTIVGFRFSGDYPHRCRLWIKPPGSTITGRVLIDPNTEAECLGARIGDPWERVR